jgi:hypothetical protein
MTMFNFTANNSEKLILWKVSREKRASRELDDEAASARSCARSAEQPELGTSKQPGNIKGTSWQQHTAVVKKPRLTACFLSYTRVKFLHIYV